MTSQVGLVFIHVLNVPCNSDIISQNQVKLGTLIKQDEKPRKYNFFVAKAICSVPIPFLLFLKHSRLLWSRIVLEVSVHTGSKKNPYMSLLGSRKWDTFVSNLMKPKAEKVVMATKNMRKHMKKCCHFPRKQYFKFKFTVRLTLSIAF